MSNHHPESTTAKPSGRTVLVAVIAVVVLLLNVWLMRSCGEEEKKPLYWVSQMDPDYRSNAPGKCPHGMDLVPVYEADLANFGGGAGVVRIAPQVQQQLGVRKAEVILGSLKQTLRASGRVVPDTALLVKMSPRVTGWIDLLFVSGAGEIVQRGQPLYALYAPQLLEVQERYLAALRQGNEREIAKTAAELRALGMDDLALNQLKTDGAAQRSVIFRAPRDGMIDMLMVTQGAYVQPGVPLLTLGSMEIVWAELDVLESQAGLIQPRQIVTLTTPAFPGLVWETAIDTVAPDLDAKTRTLRFRARLDNRNNQLRTNMQMEGLVILPARPPALLVPRQAVIQLGRQDRVVLDLGDGSFKSVAVTLGESNGEQMEVLEGLREGDRVVVSAQFLVDSESSKTSDFARMEPRPDSKPQYPPAWVEAVVEEVYPQERKARLRHQAVTAWKMPGMTMNFTVADDVDMAQFKTGARLRVLLADGDPLFQVLATAPAPAGNTP